MMIKVCSLNFKALERPWTEEFKRYFLGPFVDDLDIFATAVLVQEEGILIHFLQSGLSAAENALVIMLDKLRQKWSPEWA